MYFIYFCQNIIYIGSDMLNSMFDLTPRQRRSSIVSNRNVLYSRFAVWIERRVYKWSLPVFQPNIGNCHLPHHLGIRSA
jgi:hypothetical protein